MALSNISHGALYSHKHFMIYWIGIRENFRTTMDPDNCCRNIISIIISDDVNIGPVCL